MNIVVLSRAEAKKYNPDPSTWVISIVDPFSRNANLRNYAGSKLRLSFEDDVKGELIMNTGEGCSVIGFVKQAIASGIELMVIHCEAGISRSSGVAMALEQLYPRDIQWINRDEKVYVVGEGMISRFMPNEHVYKTLLTCSEWLT